MPIYDREERACIAKLAKRYAAGMPEFPLTDEELAKIGVGPGRMVKVLGPLEKYGLISRFHVEGQHAMMVRIDPSCSQFQREVDWAVTKSFGRLLMTLLVGALGALIANRINRPDPTESPAPVAPAAQTATK